MNMMITCKQATNFISQKEEGKLSLRQRWQLWVHLGVCAVCRIFEKQNNIIISNAPHIHEHISATLSTAEKEAIIAALEKE